MDGEGEEVISDVVEYWFLEGKTPTRATLIFLPVKYLFIYSSMAVLGPRFRARGFPSRGKRGPRLMEVRGPPTTAASLVAEHRLRNCGSRAQPLRGTWDPPRPGLEPVSPALAGRLPTTAPPGKPPC